MVSDEPTFHKIWQSFAVEYHTQYLLFAIDITEASRWPSRKESACQCRRCRRQGLNPWLGKTPGVRNGNSLQYSCLANSMDRGAWQAAVHGVPKSLTWLSTQHITNDATCYRQSLGLVLIFLSCFMWGSKGHSGVSFADSPWTSHVPMPPSHPGQTSLTLTMLSGHYQQGSSVFHARG